jgi:predicted negative regulator of RcsB-dependent stress response
MTKIGEAARPPMVVDPETLLETFQLYRKQITVVAVVVAAVAGGGFLWQASTARRTSQAEKAFYDAVGLSTSGDPKAAVELGKVAQRYDGTAGGVQAALLLAQSEFDAGKFDEGLKALNGVSKPGVFASGVESLKAAGYEGKEQFDKAAEHYLAAVAKASLTGEKDFLKGEAARALTAAGKKAEAQKLWEELAAKTDSPMSGEAKVRLGELTAVPINK